MREHAQNRNVVFLCRNRKLSSIFISILFIYNNKKSNKNESLEENNDEAQHCAATTLAKTQGQ